MEIVYAKVTQLKYGCKRDPGRCGVVVFCHRMKMYARMAFFGLFALQHRGQEAAGIAVSDGQGMSIYKMLV